MSIVRINVLQVPPGRGDVLEQRFAARAGEVEKVDGFESFDLLRPTEGTDRYLVVTKWRDESAFQAWMSSEAFSRGHAGSQQEPRSDGGVAGDAAVTDSAGSVSAHDSPGAGDRPAAVGSELWGFDVVASATGADR